MAEASEMARNKDPSGFKNPELDRLIESGVENQARTDFFYGLSEIHGSEHPEAMKVKQKIRKMIDEELEFANFKNQVSEEQRQALLEDATQEMDQRKGFFFPRDLDMNKDKSNTKSYDQNAPGNRFRHVSVAAPHEHIDI